MIRRAVIVTTLALLAAAPGALAAPTGSPSQIATGLETPWEMVELPDGRVLVTERPGRIREVAGGVLQPMPVYTEANVAKFLGLALSPDYATNKHVFLYETMDAGFSRVVRLTDTGTTLTSPTVIFTGIGSDHNHDGGRIAFGPDGFLYVTTGDIHDPTRPRDIDNLNGKILRMNEAGEPAAGNPFDTDATRSARDFVWSFGHRHPQGLTWDASGRLWESEHGPSGEAHAPAGATNGRDELNLIQPGKDYGWPDVAGDLQCSNVSTVPPVVHSGPAPAWAPGDVEYVPTDGYLYAPALAGQHLHVFDTGGGTTVTRHAAKTFSPTERLRSATMVSASEMWIATHTATMRIFDIGIAAGSAGLTWQSYTPGPPQWKTCDPPTGAPSPVGTGTGVGVGTSPPVTTTTTAVTQPFFGGTPLLGDRAVSPASRASTLAQRLRTALRMVRLRGLLRRGSVAVRAGGFDAGSRLRVRLVLRRRGRAALTVAIGQVRPRSRAPVTVRVRLGSRGRAALGHATTARLTFRVSYAPAGGTPVTRTAASIVRR